jgi:hypothetical protein
MSIAILFLKFGIGMSMIFFGINQIKRPAQWLHYIPDFAHNLFHSQQKEETIMRVHGTGNIMFGAFLLSGILPLIAAWIALLWWILVAPFGFMKKTDIGIRDTSIISAIAALIALLI